MSKNPKSLADSLISRRTPGRTRHRAQYQRPTPRWHRIRTSKTGRESLVRLGKDPYQMRQRRPGWGVQYSRKASTTGRLTKAGIWRAAQLRRPLQPQPRGHADS